MGKRKKENKWSAMKKQSAHNYEYPLPNGLCLDDAPPLLQAGKVVLAKLCSIFVKLMQGKSPSSARDAPKLFLGEKVLMVTKLARE